MFSAPVLLIPFRDVLSPNLSLDNLKIKKAAVLYDVASEYNKGIAEIFKEVYEQNGGKVVAFETYTTNDKDFSSQLTKIKKAIPANHLPAQLLQRSAAADPAGQTSGDPCSFYRF